MFRFDIFGSFSGYVLYNIFLLCNYKCICFVCVGAVKSSPPVDLQDTLPYELGTAPIPAEPHPSMSPDVTTSTRRESYQVKRVPAEGKPKDDGGDKETTEDNTAPPVEEEEIKDKKPSKRKKKRMSRRLEVGRV